MRFYFFYFLCALAFVQCKSDSQSNHSENENELTTTHQNIDVQKMKEVADNLSNDRIIIDVRTPQEINEGYIKGTIHIDYQLTDFEEKIKQLDQNKDYYVYCRSGGRSSKAAKLMTKNGFKKVHNLEGGYNAWKKAGY